MPDEIQGQMLEVTPGAEEVAVVAPEGVGDTATETVAGDVGAVTTTPVSYDLTSDDGIRAALEANPTLAGYLEMERANAANTARQRRDSEILRERGTMEAAQQHTRWIAEQLENGADPDAIAQQVPFYVKANHDTLQAEFGRAILQQAAEAGDETVAGLLGSLTGENPDEVMRVAQAALDASIRRARTEANAATRAELEAEYAERLKADIAAARVELEAANRSNPPTASGGPAGISGPVTWASIDKQFTDSQWQRLPAETRKVLSDQANAANLAAAAR